MTERPSALAMIVIPLFFAISFLPACGGDSGDSGGAAPVSTLIEQPTADPAYTAICNSVTLSGTPDYPATQWPGVVLSWANEATGESGTATTGVQECWSIIFGSYPCNPWWWATVPLQLGSNQITVTARYPGGGTETDAITVTKPSMTYSVSGKIANHDGRGIFNLKVIRRDTGDFAFTDAEGKYTMSCLADGTYTVAPSAMHFYSPEERFWSEMEWPFTPESRTVIIAGADVAGIDFSTAIYRLEGGILFGAGSPTFPFEVELTGGAAGRGRAMVNGGYYTLLAPNGTYTIHAPVSSMYTFTPAIWTTTVSGADILGLDFTGESN